MEAREIMTDNPACCTPQTSIREAAQMMAEHDCGCLPVLDDLQARHVQGVVTDRDLALRAIAQGRDFDTPVREVMSDSPACCRLDSDIRDVEQIMAERQVRRVPVLDDQDRCVGMIAQADLARETRAVGNREVGRVVESISEPTDGPRAERPMSGARPDQMR